MKKLIFTSMFAAVGLFAQNGNTPAAPQAQTNQAPSSQAPAQTTQPKHKHKKASKTNNGTTGNSQTATPNQSGSEQKPQSK